MPDDVVIEDSGITEVVIEDEVTEVVIEDVGAQGPAGSGFFIALADTPSSYAGAGGYLVVVTAGEDGLEFSATSPGSSTFVGLTDTPGAIADGQYLVGSGSDLVFTASIPAADISGLATVATTGSYDDLSDLPTLFSGSYNDLTDVPSTFAPAAHTLGSHSDVNVVGASDGDVLTLSSGTWVAAAPSGGSSAFTDLSDTPASIAANQYLRGNPGGTALVFVSSIPATDVSGLATVATSGAYSDLSGIPSTFTPSAHTHAASEITSGTFDDARISSSSVTQHEGDLTITESQISDLGNYSVVGHTHAASDVVSGTFADARISEDSVTQHEGALTITESQISDLGNYSVVGHTHTASEITDFSTAADARIAAATLEDLSDVTVTANTTGEILRWNGSSWVNATLAESGIPTTFLGLSDTPSTYAGIGTRTVKVKADNSGLEFVLDTATATPSFRSINETPSSYSGHALKVVRVNAAENAVEFGPVLAAIASSGSASDLSTGSIPNARVPASAVTQHQAALSIATSQLTGSMPDARIVASNVTQHQGSITITASQVSDFSTAADARIAAASLNALSDVTITSVASGEILAWTGSAWENQTLAEAGVAAASHTHAASDITSGTFADARVAESNVTQHAGALPFLSAEGTWATSTAYVEGDFVFNDGIAYLCVNAHTSGASTEPGIGADWEDEWDRVAPDEVDVNSNDEVEIGYYNGSKRYRHIRSVTIASTTNSPVNLGALPRTPSKILVFGGSINVASQKVQLPYVGYASGDGFAYNLANVAGFLFLFPISLSGGTAPDISSGWVVETYLEYT